MQKYQVESDEVLMLLFTQGDDAAFAELVKRYSDKVYNYIYRYISDEERAREIAQEVFLRVFRSRNRYSVKAKFSTFIYRIAINLSYNEVRDRNRRKTDATDNFTLMKADDSLRPDKEFEKKEIQRIVRDKINKLEPKYRDVIILCDLENMSYKEAGKVLSISVGTVQSRLSRGRIKLRQTLSDIVDYNQK